jgi:hypothetical protein
MQPLLRGEENRKRLIHGGVSCYAFRLRVNLDRS